MEKVWNYTNPKKLTDEEKNMLLKKVFDSVAENEMYEDMGESISDFLTFNGYVYQEIMED